MNVGARRAPVHRIEAPGLASAEGDDAALGVVRRDPNRDPIAGHHLDAEAAHPAAQLGEHFVSGVALNAIQPSAVHCHDRPLHVD